MQRLSGLLLIVAGATIGAHQFSSGSDKGAEQLAEVVRISAAPDRETVAAAQAPRTFSAATPLIAPETVTAPSPVVTKAPAAQPWSTIVTADPATPGSRTLKSSKAGDDATRSELARDLQRELSRVGCYGGEINGAWTAPTRRAMAAFMQRVNATLPLTEPDYILLTLVQGEKAAVCTASCPAKQVMANDGRCTPAAVAEQASRKAQRAEQRRIEAEARQVEREQRTGAQRQAAEAAHVATQARTAPVPASAPETAPARIAAGELPWLSEDVSTRRELLPGRMSVGAAAVAPTAPVASDDANGPAAALRAREALAAVEPIDAGPEARSGATEVDGGDGAAYVPPISRNENLRGAKPVRRPAPVASARPKRKKYYADAGYSPKRKSRRGLPRPGTIPFYMQQSLGGFY